MPTISVIIPVYKVEPYLHQCVDSVLNQTFKNFKIILVDDGSPDNCPAVCDEYSKKDNRVFVIHKENGGLSSARNAGLDYVFSSTNSEYITFIDGDDSVEPNYLQLLLDAFIKSDNTMVAIANFSRLLPSFKKKANMVVFQETEFNGLELLKKATCEQDGYVYTTAWGKLFKKEAIGNTRFPINKLHEDEYFSNSIFKQKLMIVVVPEPLYCYRINENGIISNTKLQSTFDGFDALYSRYLFCKKMLSKDKKYMLAAEEQLLWHFNYVKSNNRSHTIFFYSFFFRMIRFLFHFPIYSFSLRIRLKFIKVCFNKL